MAKILTIATGALLLSTPLAQADIIIRNHPGGRIGEVLARVDHLRQRGERVIVDGRCASACTLHLRNRRICVTERAVFIFHGAIGASDPQQRVVEALYPAHVQAAIARKGGLHDGMQFSYPGTHLALLCRAI